MKSPYQITLVKDTGLHSAFEIATSGTLKTLWDTKFAEKEKSLQNNIAVMKGDKFALFERRTIVRSQPEYKDCSITDTGYVLMSFDNAFPVAKNSPFKELFNHALTKIQESGELHKIKENYRIQEPDCGGAKGNSLGFDRLGFAFVVFAIGPILAGILLLGEIIKKSQNCKKQEKPKKCWLVK